MKEDGIVEGVVGVKNPSIRDTLMNAAEERLLLRSAQEFASVKICSRRGSGQVRSPYYCSCNSWIQRLVGNSANQQYYTSAIMHLVSWFVLQLRQTAVAHTPQIGTGSMNCLSDNLQPQYFDNCLQATLNCANQDVEDIEDLGTLSNAVKISYEHKHIVGMKQGIAIRMRNNVAKEAKK